MGSLDIRVFPGQWPAVISELWHSSARLSLSLAVSPYSQGWKLGEVFIQKESCHIVAPGLYKQSLHFWVNYLGIPGDFYQLASDAGEKVDKHGDPDTENFEQWEGWVFDRGCLLLFWQKQAEEGDSVAEVQLHAVLLGQELSQETGLAWGEQQIQTWEKLSWRSSQVGWLSSGKSAFGRGWNPVSPWSLAPWTLCLGTWPSVCICTLTIVIVDVTTVSKHQEQPWHRHHGHYRPQYDRGWWCWMSLSFSS